MRTNQPTIPLLIFVILLVPILAACGGSTSEPTSTPVETDASVTLPPEEPPTSTPVPPTDVPTETPAPSGDLWAQIEARGSLVAGTSADYPPFEYIDPDTFLLDGFDMALIREIGRRLGLQVEIHDMGFDGLGDSLQLHEIDVAVAAISASVERLAYVDFTNVYYVGADAILAKAGSGKTITNVEDLAGARIGVQRGSVYENWIQGTLVNTGLLPQENLITYLTTVNALTALSSPTPEIDYLVMDLRPAEEAALGGAVEIVIQGLNQQLLFHCSSQRGVHSAGEVKRHPAPDADRWNHCYPGTQVPSFDTRRNFTHAHSRSNPGGHPAAPQYLLRRYGLHR